MSKGRSFWNELRERRVVRVAIGYLAVAWVLIEGADTLTSVLALPPVTARVVFALLALGFPLAVVLAWAFQRTPEGLQRSAPFGDGRSRLPFYAAAAGDTARAVRAYRDYLTLREATADASLRAEIDEVEAELARLTGG